MVSGSPVRLNARVKGENYTIRWLPETGLSDPTSLTPLANPTGNATYYLHVTSIERDCEIPPDTVNVRVLPGLIIPNAFTPNGDGINDTWEIVPLEAYETATVTVFARNGKIVFRSVGYPKAWGGRFEDKDLPVGIYYYTIHLKNDTKPLSGSVFITK
jgi:gliding motility-associated-like protein